MVGIKVEKVDGKITAEVNTDVVTAIAMLIVAAHEISNISGVEPKKVLMSAVEAMDKAEKPCRDKFEQIKINFE